MLTEGTASNNKSYIYNATHREDTANSALWFWEEAVRKMLKLFAEEQKSIWGSGPERSKSHRSMSEHKRHSHSVEVSRYISALIETICNMSSISFWPGGRFTTRPRRPLKAYVHNGSWELIFPNCGIQCTWLYII
jgi:hypothetical protein